MIKIKSNIACKSGGDLIPKRKETLEIENALYQMCREKRIYGCEEVTIGFYNNGHGNEIVDFMTMDSKGIVKCYEVKVILSDLKSKAKKSWYGNFNYLVVSNDLYNKVSNWDDYLPTGVGLIREYERSYGNRTRYVLESVFKAKSRELSIEDSMMLKESFIRSMYYKMIKYKDSADMDKTRELNRQIKYWEKQYRESNKRCNDMFHYKMLLSRIDRKIKEKQQEDLSDKEIDILQHIQSLTDDEFCK